MKVRQSHEWKVLLASSCREREKLARRAWEASGLAVYLKKIAVIRHLLEYYERRKRKSLEEQHAALQASLRLRHENAAELRRRYAALERHERRELFTFEQSFPPFSGQGDKFTFTEMSYSYAPVLHPDHLQERRLQAFHEMRPICSVPSREDWVKAKADAAGRKPGASYKPSEPVSLFRNNAYDVTVGTSSALTAGQGRRSIEPPTTASQQRLR
jgi:hypothetical protein